MIKHKRFGWHVIGNPKDRLSAKLCICFVDQQHCLFKLILQYNVFTINSKQCFDIKFYSKYVIFSNQIRYGLYIKEAISICGQEMKICAKTICVLTAASAGFSSWKGEKQLLNVLLNYIGSNTKCYCWFKIFN